MLSVTQVLLLVLAGLISLISLIGLIVLIAVRWHRRLRARAQIAARNYEMLQTAFIALNSGEYIAQSELTAWKTKYAAAILLATSPRWKRYLTRQEIELYNPLIEQLVNPDNTVLSMNAAFKLERIQSNTIEFDKVETYPLTDKQRDAIVTNEDTTLVIAGAGTGKTSTIIGKVDYILRHQLAQPTEILVLAFAKKASIELKLRLAKFSDAKEVDISTFHALGLRIIGEVLGSRPAITNMAEDPVALKNFIRNQIKQMLKNPITKVYIRHWFSRNLDEITAPLPTASNDEYIQRQKQLGLRALNDVLLKSRQEVQIANWLILNGINFEYERQYPENTATPWRRPYCPDFYLPDSDIYIEHFGVDRHGNTAPHVNAAQYRASIEWKRALHLEYGTRLIETFSWMHDEGTLDTALETLLLQQGVEIDSLTTAEIIKITAETNQVFSIFITLIAQFLNNFKSNNLTIDTLQSRPQSVRDRVFIHLFEAIFEAYGAALNSRQEIDFHDMINKARHCVQTGGLSSHYKYIIVDEFQDISENRLGLLQDLRAHTPHARLFAVGDDWQSIYRFAGSDISVITTLASRVGATARVDLDITFRYPQNLLDVTAGFIQKNKLQLSKSIRAHGGVGSTPPIWIMYQTGDDLPAHTLLALEQIGAHIAQATGGGTAKVFLIGRYNFNRPSNFEDIKATCLLKNIQIEFLTAHASKGREADYVVIVGMDSGTYGFPSNIPDDPVMAMVLSKPEQYKHAEERRLFYVAMTRAKHQVYLIAQRDRASPFVRDDLSTLPLSLYVRTHGEPLLRYHCPKCHGETIRNVSGPYGPFWACSHYPICHGKLPMCPECPTGGLEAPQSLAQPLFKCTDCPLTAKVCPRCKAGYLVQRTNIDGNFFGCSEYRDAGCTYTSPLD